MQSGFTDFNGAMARLGNCSRDTIDRKVKSGQLAKYYLGNKVLFRIEELDALPTRQAPGAAGNDNAEPAAA
mgnify:CR=1 FL=1